jgi:hypothetical protein
MTFDFNLEEKKKFVDSLKNDDEKLVICEFNEINDGDIISSFTITHSQKYLLKEGCEEYNMKKIGIMLRKNNDDPEESIIFAYDKITKTFFETNFYKNPGTSGCFILKKYV